MAVARHPIPIRAGRQAQADKASQSVAPSRHTTNDGALTRPKRSNAWAVLIMTMVVTLIFILIWMRLVTPWWQGVQEQWQYGSTHITQLDTNVGHGGVSHFVAQYYHSEIVIIELSQSDPAQCHVYTLRGFYGVTNTPVVLLSVGATQHHGKPDLLVSIAGTDFAQTLYNTGSAFSESEG